MAEIQTPAPQEEKKSKSKRDLFSERLKERYPDREYADDEELFGQINDDYDAYDEQVNQYKDRERKLIDTFSNNPKAARFFIDMVDGKDPYIETIRQLGIDGITDLINDPDKQEEYAAANTEFLERLAKNKELEEEFQNNFADSMQLIDQMQEERGIDDETMDAAYGLVQRIANEALLGKYTAETMEIALKAVNHDSDVAEARAEGEVAGRNAKIEEKLRKPNAGDGVPNLGGSHNNPGKGGRKSMSIFDYADAAR